MNNPKLKLLPVNKTVVIYSPIEGNDVLTRTGVISDSCFYHAILHATSTEYVLMDENNRTQFVNKLKQSLKDIFTLEMWKELKNSHKFFTNRIQFIYFNFIRFINKDPKAKGKSTRKVIKNLINDKTSKLEYFDIIAQLIPIDIFNEILKETIMSIDVNDIDDIKTNVVKNIIKYYLNIQEIKYLDRERQKFFQKLITTMFEQIFVEAEYSAYKAFLVSLYSKAKISPLIMNLLSTKLNRDIYILNSNTRMPIEGLDQNIQKRRSIILIKINDHYEPIGRLLAGNKVQRDFAFDDIVIHKLYTFVCNPENIHHCYVELSSYLPNQYKFIKDKDYEDSGIDTDSETDEYSLDFTSDTEKDHFSTLLNDDVSDDVTDDVHDDDIYGNNNESSTDKDQTDDDLHQISADKVLDENEENESICGDKNIKNEEFEEKDDDVDNKDDKFEEDNERQEDKFEKDSDQKNTGAEVDDVDNVDELERKEINNEQESLDDFVDDSDKESHFDDNTSFATDKEEIDE